jgi:hypothetical protein
MALYLIIAWRSKVGSSDSFRHLRRRILIQHSETASTSLVQLLCAAWQHNPYLHAVQLPLQGELPAGGITDVLRTSEDNSTEQAVDEHAKHMTVHHRLYHQPFMRCAA